MTGNTTAPGGRIVIVEDSELVSEALRLLFADSGYDVSVAESVAEAVGHCQASPVDVMLLDLTLPDGDGLEVLSKLDEGGTTRPRRTIALTGHGDLQIRKRCLDAGCERVLLKPVSIRELLSMVREG
jgi:two-component system, OmpR family, response regulator MprA